MANGAAGEKVGFFKLISSSDQGTMIGALLVTDAMGMPEEFRVTHPVKPTLIQRQLYGDSLFRHVGVDLCGKPLSDVLENHPALIVVSHRQLLALAEQISTPVVFLELVENALRIKASDSGQKNQIEKIQSKSESFEPVFATYPASYSLDRQVETATLTKKLFNRLDLLEPFNRIDVSVRVLQGRDKRFR
jgi:hypothetical protein